MKYGPLEWLLGRSMEKMMIQRVLTETLSALADYVQFKPETLPQTA